MLAGKMQQKDTDTTTRQNGKIDNSPLIMFAASPGTIATLITISINEGEKLLPIVTLISVMVSLLLTWVTMVVMASLPQKKKASGTSFATQFMGLILIAMGLQFAMEGYKAFMGIC